MDTIDSHGRTAESAGVADNGSERAARPERQDGTGMRARIRTMQAELADARRRVDAVARENRAQMQEMIAIVRDLAHEHRAAFVQLREMVDLLRLGQLLLEARLARAEAQEPATEPSVRGCRRSRRGGRGPAGGACSGAPGPR